MSGSFLSSIYRLVERRRIVALCALGALFAASVAGLAFVRYNNTIELMLPQDPAVTTTMRFLREANFSDKLVISLRLTDEAHTTQDLIAAADVWASSLRSPLIKQATSDIGISNVMSGMVSYLQYTPQLLGPGSLPSLAGLITPEGVRERLKLVYRQSLAPGSSFMMPFLRADPLGISSGILRDVEKLSSSLGYEVVITNGHLVSKDGTHVMVIVKTPVALTEGFGARKLVTYLQESLRGLPGYVAADIIAGHMHTVSNEDVIKKDIWLTTGIASVAFVLLFLFFFRDAKAVIVFCIPLVAVAVSTNITYLVFKSLSYFVIGLGTVIAGIAIDYGIYVYIAVRKAGRSQETIRQVIKPVVFGAMTTISVFAVFFFSSVQGYRQLAFFSNVSIVLCLLLALFVVPHFLSKEKNSLHAPAARLLPRGPGVAAHDRLCIVIWAACMVVASALGLGLHFKNDITQFDGAGREVLLAEKSFHEVWGGKVLPAIMVVSARTLDGAYQLNSRAYEAVSKKIGRDTITSFASVWPGSATRKSNLARWQEFWTPEKEVRIRELLGKYGKEYHYADNAFEPFFLQLHSAAVVEAEPKGNAFFDHLKEQFVIGKEGGYQIVSYFPDEDTLVAQVARISRTLPGTFLVSRKNFSRDISRALGSELIFLSILAVALTVGLTFLLLRDARLATLAMVPVVTSIAMIAGVLSVTRLALNMPSIIAAMVVVGIVSDYGMFVVYYCKHQYATGTYTAVTFAAGTTLIGVGVLLFARHPMLFSIGVTLATGVLSGYIASMLVIPPLYRCWVPAKEVSVAKV